MNGKTSERLIYIGPTTKGHKLVKYQVFISGLPKHTEDVFEACPQIKNLFVPVEQLAAAEEQVQKAGTPLNKYYALALKMEV